MPSGRPLFADRLASLEHRVLELERATRDAYIEDVTAVVDKAKLTMDDVLSRHRELDKRRRKESTQLVNCCKLEAEAATSKADALSTDVQKMSDAMAELKQVDHDIMTLFNEKMAFLESLTVHQLSSRLDDMRKELYQLATNVALNIDFPIGGRRGRPTNVQVAHSTAEHLRADSREKIFMASSEGIVSTRHLLPLRSPSAPPCTSSQHSSATFHGELRPGI